MAATLSQSNWARSTAEVSSIQVTLSDASLTNPSLLVVTVGLNTAGGWTFDATDLDDDRSVNAYSLDLQYDPVPTYDGVACYSRQNTGTDASVTITYTPDGSCWIDLCAYEITGAATSNAYENGIVGSGTSKAPSSGNFVVTADDFIVGHAITYCAADCNSWAANAGYSISDGGNAHEDDCDANMPAAAFYKANNGSTTANAGATFTSTSNSAWHCLGAGYLAAAGGATTLTAAQGSAAITGQAARLNWQQSVKAAQGSIAITGQAARLNWQQSIKAQQGAVAVTGQAARLNWEQSLKAAQTSLTATGQTANLNWHQLIKCEQGAAAVAGQDVTLTIVPAAGANSIIAEQGSSAITGQDARLQWMQSLKAAMGRVTAYVSVGADIPGLPLDLLRWHRLIRAEQNSASIAGQEARLQWSRIRKADQGSVAATGQAAWLKAERLIKAEQSALAITGNDIDFAAERLLKALHATVSISGQAVTLDYSGAIPIIAPEERTIKVAAERRVMVIASESRRIVIPAEDRSVDIRR